MREKFVEFMLEPLVGSLISSVGMTSQLIQEQFYQPCCQHCLLSLVLITCMITGTSLLPPSSAHLPVQGRQFLDEECLEGICTLHLDKLEGHFLKRELALGERYGCLLIPGAHQDLSFASILTSVPTYLPALKKFSACLIKMMSMCS